MPPLTHTGQDRAGEAFREPAPRPASPRGLSFIITDYHLAIMPADGQGGIDRRSGGGGPYRLDEFEPGVRARHVRFEIDWDTNRGFLDEMPRTEYAPDTARFHLKPAGLDRHEVELAAADAAFAGAVDDAVLFQNSADGAGID